MVDFDKEAIQNIIQGSYRLIRDFEGKKISKGEAITKMVALVEKEVKGAEDKYDNK